MRKLLPLLLLAILGCRQEVESPIPPTAGDFVSNDNGVGTAQAFGIQFRLPAAAGSATTEDLIHADFNDFDKSTASKKFTLGDDVVIELNSVDAKTVRFRLNGQDFGMLQVGNQVEIDAERQVKVNGTARSPQGAE